MARSLLANAFFLGSVLVTGALANDPHANTAGGSIPDAHAMQEQGSRPSHREQVTTAVRNLEEAKRALVAAKDPAQVTHPKCDAFAAKCDTADAKWPDAGDRDCDTEFASDKLARKHCHQCNKSADKCAAAKAKQMEKNIKKAEKAVTKAQAKLDKAENKCRSYLSKDLKCSRVCANGTPSGIEASNCVCTCKDAWFGAKCDQTTTPVPDTQVPAPPTPPATPCCEAGARSIKGAKPAKWRASFPDDSLNSRMPEVVFETTELGSRISVVCDHTRNGPLAVKHELSKSDPQVANSTRCESFTHDKFRTPVNSMVDAPVSGIEKGKETFYGMSVYLGGKNDDGTWAWPFNTEGGEDVAGVKRADSKLADILFQWKAHSVGPFMTVQQKYDGLYLGLGSRGMLSLVTKMDRSKWYDIMIRVKWDTDASKGEVEARCKPADEGTYAKAGISSKHPDHGKAVWHGATMTGDHDAYLKWGLYLDHWREAAEDETPEDGHYTDKHDNIQLHTLHSTRAVWHDNIAVGDCWHSVDPSAKDCDVTETGTCNSADQ